MAATKELYRIAKNATVLVISSILLIGYGIILCAVLFLNQFIPIARLRKYVILCCKRFGYHLTIAVIGSWFQNPIFIKYDKSILHYKRTVTISNHCSDYDWFFLLVLFHEMGMHDSRILLKKSLGEVPLLGYVIRKFGHICLNRSKIQDIRIIRNAMSFIGKQLSYNMAMYPEGTYIFPEAMEKARKFARDTGIAIDNEPYIPKLVLLPRKTGFNVVTQCLDDTYDGIIDVTIMMNPYVYMPSKECPPSDIFLKENQMINQFLLIDFVPRSEVTEGYLERSFKKKENRIRAHIDHSTAPVDTEEKFLDTLQWIEETKENEEIKTLYAYSPYKLLIYSIPLASLISLLIFLSNKSFL